jgi:hypothetical protein
MLFAANYAVELLSKTVARVVTATDTNLPTQPYSIPLRKAAISAQYFFKDSENSLRRTFMKGIF